VILNQIDVEVLQFTQWNQFGVVHINVEWIKQKSPREEA
ncbi:uncharacterized protein METZ01_LOCUS241012, partial [marine metagenome]